MRPVKPLIAATFCAAAAAAFAFLPSARAATEMRTGGPPAEYVDYLKMKPMQAMHMMDADKKGYVTKEEFMKFHEELFEKIDKDHDGKLSMEECMGPKGSKSKK